jgi:hypothetical protein
MLDTVSWSPFIVLDLDTASNRAFLTVLQEFKAWAKTQEPRPLDLENGWKTITPEIAEAMLLRDVANRQPTLSTIQYYARQMVSGNWKKTGQPVIFSSSGKLLDAGHRLWACYQSGATFETYLVGDVEDDNELFAYIDNSKARTPADALFTAGLNGQSKLLAQVVIMTALYEAHCYTATSKKHLDKMAPIEVVNMVSQRPAMRAAARLMCGEHESAMSVIGHHDVATFTAFKILELHDEPTLEDFMTELGHGTCEEGSPILALQKEMAKDKAAIKPMKKYQVLGHVIKAFNYWLRGEDQVKKISLRVNEDFPEFSKPLREATAE